MVTRRRAFPHHRPLYAPGPTLRYGPLLEEEQALDERGKDLVFKEGDTHPHCAKRTVDPPSRAGGPHATDSTPDGRSFAAPSLPSSRPAKLLKTSIHLY